MEKKIIEKKKLVKTKKKSRSFTIKESFKNISKIQ